MLGVFPTELNRLPKGHAKRTDFLWKLSKSVTAVPPSVAEYLAFAAAKFANEYAYDLVDIGEAAELEELIAGQR